MTRVARAAPALGALIEFTVYMRTLLPGMAFGDWGEMQTVPHILGIAHPTGYPTYLILAWLGQLIPIGSVAFRANLLSAAFVSVALALTVTIAIRLGVRPIVAGAAAISLGAVSTIWSAATAAEVNALHLLFVALLLHRALVWEHGRRTRDLVVGGLLLGLSVGNHLLILSIAPFIVLFVLWVGRRDLVHRGADLARAAIAVAAGVSVYLYIPIAAGQSPVLAYNHPITLERVWWLVSGAQFRSQFDFLTPTGPAEFVGSLGALWTLLASRGTVALPILGLIGIAILVRRQPPFGLTLLAILIIGAYVWADYMRLEHYLLVPWLVLAIGAAATADSAARQLDRLPGVRGLRVAGRRIAGGGPMVGLAGLVFAVGLAAANWRASDRSADSGGERFVSAALSILPPNAAFLTSWDASTPLWHAQLVLGLRPDVLVVDDTNIVYDGWGSREARIASLICTRPVFLLRLEDKDLTAIRSSYRVVPVAEVEVGNGGPTASLTRPIDRIDLVDERPCEHAGEGTPRAGDSGARAADGLPLGDSVDGP